MLAAAVAVLLLLLPMTPFALLPLKLGNFVEGLALGLCIVLSLIWLSHRSMGNSRLDGEAKRAQKERS